VTVRAGRVDPVLVGKWIRGWALSREKPQPQAIAGGWRVDVNEPEQAVRYVFSHADETVQQLTASISPRFTPVKICATPEDVAPLLAAPWVVERTAPMMTKVALAKSPSGRPDDYSVVLTGAGDVLIAFALTHGGDIAAGGRVALVDDVAVFDQISTNQAHQRRGLGGAIMRALENAAVERSAKRGMLVATDAGSALYLTLGWEVYGPYTTAIVPGA
jgi:GNAT superfamily N-acetyltransferase